jgi:hypothetical protein
LEDDVAAGRLLVTALRSIHRSSQEKRQTGKRERGQSNNRANRIACCERPTAPCRLHLIIGISLVHRGMLYRVLQLAPDLHTPASQTVDEYIFQGQLRSLRLYGTWCRARVVPTPRLATKHSACSTYQRYSSMTNCSGWHAHRHVDRARREDGKAPTIVTTLNSPTSLSPPSSGLNTADDHRSPASVGIPIILTMHGYAELSTLPPVGLTHLPASDGSTVF